MNRKQGMYLCFVFAFIIGIIIGIYVGTTRNIYIIFFDIFILIFGINLALLYDIRKRK